MASPLIRVDDSEVRVRDVIGNNNEVYFARLALNFNDLNPELKETLEKALTEIMHEKLIHEAPAPRQVLAVEGAVDGLALYHPLKELELALQEKEVKDMIEMYCMTCQVDTRPACAQDLFASMIHSGRLRLQDFTFLQSLLWKAGRSDLFKSLAEKARKLQELHQNDSSPLRISHLDAPSLVPIEGYSYIKFHLKVDLLDIGTERLQKLERELARLLGVPQEYVAVVGVEPDQSAWVTVILPTVACRLLQQHFDEGAMQNFLLSLDIDKVAFFPDPGKDKGADEGCVSKLTDPEHTETKSRDEGDGTRSSASVFDKAKVPIDCVGKEYFFGYPRRGRALIISNTHFRGMPKKRPKSDEKLFRKVFQKLGFNMKICRDLSVDEMRQVLQDEAEADHSEEDCFVCAVATYGGEEFADKTETRKVDVLLGRDSRVVPTEELLQILSDENCPSLKGKPRLFFIQACLGEMLDDDQVDVYVYEDKKTEEQTSKGEDRADEGDKAGKKDEASWTSFSQNKDFLVAYATKPGHAAFSRAEGSWFVQSLYDAVEQAHGDVSLMDVLARAADIQAKFVSKSTDVRLHGKRTFPHITHSLTKDVIFRPK